jgi:hypothetical protein
MLVWSYSRETRLRGPWRTIGLGLTTILLAVVVVVLSAQPAAAGVKWCEDDPLITVNGRTAHVAVGFSTDDLPKVNGKITYYVIVAQSYLAGTTIDASMAALPTEVHVYPVADDTMKQWWGERIKVTVLAHVPAKRSFSTVTTVTDFSQVLLERKHGKANTWVEVNFTLE